MELKYETRDAKGNDFVKMVQVKEFPIVKADFECPICHKSYSEGVESKKIISGNFTDFAYIDKYVCTECSALFSLYFYNYIVDKDGIRLLNVRQIRQEICKPQKPPFRFIITTSQKKHLFYRSILNYNPDYFAVNLETEVIYTTTERMKTLFDFVENLLTLGASKKALAEGQIPLDVLIKTGFGALTYLRYEIQHSREIQIPLYCGQKNDKKEYDCLCSMDSILKAWKEQKPL